MDSSAKQFREVPTRFRNARVSRLVTIKRRAEYLNGAWLARDEASLTRELDEGDLEERRRIGAAAGAAWVARARGR